MKVKPKNAKSAILLIVIIVGAILAMRYFNIGAPRSALRVGYVGNEGWSSWTAKYTTLDGNMQRTLHPKDDVLHIMFMDYCLSRPVPMNPSLIQSASWLPNSWARPELSRALWKAACWAMPDES